MNNTPEHFKVVEPRWTVILSMWWAFFWRTFISYILFALAAALFLSVFSIKINYLPYFGYMAFLMTTYLVFRTLLLKGFGKNKRLIIVEEEEVIA